MNLARLNPFRAVRSLYDYLSQRMASRRIYVHGDSTSGVPINHQTAMAFTVFARCVAVIAGDVSCLDLILKRRRADGGADYAVGHPHWRIWSLQPAAYLTRQRWLEQLMGAVLCRGNAYSEIELRGGQPVAIHPIDPTAIEPIGLASDKIVYRYTHPAGKTVYPTSDQVLHVRGYSEDGLVGLAPLTVIRNCLGLGMAAENFGASLFKNGAVPKGILTHPGVLNDEAFEALRQSFQRNHSADNWNRFAILDRGLTYQPTGINPGDAQFLETRKFQRAEIAGWFGVPLHRLNDTERATWSNVESLGLDYVIYTLTPWLVRIEQEINARFYPDGQYFVEFNFDTLLRGDLTARANYYRTLFGMGALSINEIRAREGLNPVGTVGDIHWMPLNVAPADEVLSSPSLGAATENRALTEYLAKMLPHLPAINPAGPPAAQVRAVAEDAARRVARKESRALAAAIGRHLDRGNEDLHGFTTWAERFYAEQRAYFIEALKPAAELAGAAGRLDQAADAYVRDAASQISDRLLDVPQLRAWAAGREAAAAALLDPLISQEMAAAV